MKIGGLTREVVSLDCKCIKGSKDIFHEQNPIYMVSAWASENELVLGQLKVNEKSNEITAIPLLLDLLDLKGSIVTIDAIGTQTKIAKKIIENEADYILSVKGNQKELLQEIESRFNHQRPSDIDETIDKGHGRIEIRKCETITDLRYLNESGNWEGLKTIVKITAQRETDKKQETEVRYYISSVEDNAKNFNSYIRQHWGIENKLHWTLDMIFDEDR